VTDLVSRSEPLPETKKKEDNKIKLEKHFDDCGFLKVKINKKFKITDHGL
jgi:hypothetical protein